MNYFFVGKKVVGVIDNLYLFLKMLVESLKFSFFLNKMFFYLILGERSDRNCVISLE